MATGWPCAVSAAAVRSQTKGADQAPWIRTISDTGSSVVMVFTILISKIMVRPSVIRREPSRRAQYRSGMASVDRARAGRPRTEGLDEALLEAALEELGRVGYARMRLETVARLAGTTKPTLYLRYPSKVALVSAALGSLRNRTPRELTGDVRDDLVAELRLLRRGAIERKGISMLGAALVEEHENPEITALYREHVVLPRRENLRRVMEAGKASGQLRADADTELGITMLVGSLYAAHAAGEVVSPDWPERVVAAWLDANGPADAPRARPRRAR